DNFLFYRLTIRTQKKGSKSNNIDDIELFGTTNNSSFSCENKERIFVAPKAGYYKLEAWGAQGGSYNDTWHGGYGGYSTAIVNLEQGQKLYINVGCSPNKHQYPLTFVAGGYNGGGSAYSYDLGTQAGGGATTISYESGTLHSSYSTATFNNILLVAGGGGGAYYYEDEYSLGSNSVVGGNGGGEPKYNRYDGRRSLINDIRPSDGYVIANTYPEEACIKLYGTWENGTSCTLPYNATEETIQDPPNFPFRYADSTGSDVGRDYFTLVHHDGYTKTDYNVGSQCDTYYLSSNTLSHDSFGGGGGLIDGHFGCLSEAISSVNCDTGYNAPPSRAAICGALTGTQTTLTPSNEINSYFKPTAMYVEHYASAECGVVSGNQCINGCVRNSWAGCCGTGCTVADLTHVSAHTDVTYSKTRFAATGGSSYIKAGLINPSLTEKNEDDSSAMPTPGYMKKGNGYASVRFIGTTLS
ncbi:MAG: hypothetical protein J6W64_06195, partial [Bacilli bacterium]|nr:hypothetical protein [Bacilli bacterium]